MAVAVAVGCGLLGLAAGPLVNAVIDRVPAKERLLPLWPRCPGCGTPIRGLLPTVARLASRHRRCRGCGATPSPRHPLVDVATAALFAAAALRFGADWALPAYLVFFASLLAVAVIDVDHQIIPNRVVYPTIVVSVPLLALAAALQHGWPPLGRALVGAVLAWAVLLVVHLVSPGGMGFGDVRLSFVLGLFLGWISLAHVVMGVFLGFLLGAAGGVVQLVAGRRHRGDHIPFGPFLAGGAAVAVLGGWPILRWYLGG